MTFIEQLKAHIGGIVRLKTDLFWYDSRNWDGIEGRICILLDATINPPDGTRVDAASSIIAAEAAMFLLVDSSTKWVWASKEDVEFIQ
jgi:hypothetical protein